MSRIIGFHVSIAGGIYRAFSEARARGINGMQIFLKSSNRWNDKPYGDDAIARFNAERETHAFAIFAHSAYLINPATTETEMMMKSRLALTDELNRAALLGVPYLVLHPGSHKGAGVERGIRAAAELIDAAFEHADGNCRILLENTSGQGDCIGHRMEHLRDIIAHSNYQDRYGVCFDTCHAFAAGYELSGAGLAETIELVVQTTGIEKVKLIHLNDSKMEFGSRKDRHENLGVGKIGDALADFINAAPLKDIPLIMETPKGDDELQGDLANLAYLKKMMQ